MADNKDESTSSWYKVPTWDGSPLTWRSFRREMDWWVSSLDLEGTRKYNLAARWLLRQTGVVRQRGEEFTPKELEYQKEMRGRDDEGNETVLVEEDLLAGLHKLLASLEEINSLTTLDKRGELRNLFYQQLGRRPGERVSEFCSRFRTVVADLKQEGVKIPDSELGWFLREKVGLDPLRKQLLDTALEARRNMPSSRRRSSGFSRTCTRATRSLRRLVCRSSSGRGGPLLGSSSSVASRFTSSSYRSPSARSSSATSTPRAPFRPQLGRQANVAEAEDEEGKAEDYNEDEGHSDEEPAGLEEVLQTEAEALAAEIEELAEEGADDELIGGLEASVEAGAEALVSMREARSRLQQVRKDRGYQAPGGAPAGKKGTTAASRKASGKHPCFDCGEHGHWAGERQAKIAEHEAQVIEYEIPASPTAATAVHEVLTIDHLPLDEALAHGALVSSPATPSAQHLEGDGIGALDSACNRTCAGPRWLQNYLDLIETVAPESVQNMVHHVPEKEAFKFGNGGVTPSYERWRLPGVLCGRLFALWVSIVPVPSLGLLMGRDWMEAVGAVIDFEQKVLACRRLFEGCLELFQLRAGHFMVNLLPSEPDPESWGLHQRGHLRRCGLDGVVELQMSSRQWLSRLIEMGRGASASAAEHVLSEASLASGREVMSVVRGRALATATLSARSRSLRSPSMSRTWNHGRRAPLRDLSAHSGHSSMEPVPAATSRSRPMAHRRRTLVAFATALLALCAASFPLGVDGGGLEAPSGEHGATGNPGTAASRASASLFDGFAAGRSQLASGSAGPSAFLSRGPLGRRHVGRPGVDRPGKVLESGRSSRPTAGSPGTSREARPGRGGEVVSWAEGRATYPKGRPVEAGGAPPCGSRGQGHRRLPQEEDPA